MHSGKAASVHLILMATLLLIFPAVLPADSAGESSDSPKMSTYAADAGEYEPYKPEEFPRWARDLRRFETILIGSIPFMFLFTNLGFDTYAYIKNDFQADYLPLFSGLSPKKEDFRNETKFKRLTVSVTLSGIIAVLDYILGKAKNERARRSKK